MSLIQGLAAHAAGAEVLPFKYDPGNLKNGSVVLMVNGNIVAIVAPPSKGYQFGYWIRFILGCPFVMDHADKKPGVAPSFKHEA